MPITINGSGSVTGISAGGLPDGCITAPELDGAQSGSAPIYAARAWVNFNGTGTVSTNQTIRASGNVTSVFKNGTGDYTVNFTTAMADANYSVTGTGGAPGTSNGFIQCAENSTARTATLVRIANVAGGFGTVADGAHINVAIFR
jgi:hypothetical protein